MRRGSGSDRNLRSTKKNTSEENQPQKKRKEQQKSPKKVETRQEYELRMLLRELEKSQPPSMSTEEKNQQKIERKIQYYEEEMRRLDEEALRKDKEELARAVKRRIRGTRWPAMVWLLIASLCYSYIWQFQVLHCSLFKVRAMMFMMSLDIYYLAEVFLLTNVKHRATGPTLFFLYLVGNGRLGHDMSTKVCSLQNQTPIMEMFCGNAMIMGIFLRAAPILFYLRQIYRHTLDPQFERHDLWLKSLSPILACVGYHISERFYPSPDPQFNLTPPLKIMFGYDM